MIDEREWICGGSSVVYYFLNDAQHLLSPLFIFLHGSQGLMGKHQPFGASNESCLGGGSGGLVSRGTGEDIRTAVLWNVGNEQVKGR